MMLSTEAPAFRFWGKAQPVGNGADWHPLVYHCLDVAAVGRVHLTRNPQLTTQLVEKMGLEEQSATDLLSLLLAFHDLGKFSRPFQAKMPALYPAVLGTPETPSTPHHDAAGLILWRNPAFATARAVIAANDRVVRQLGRWVGASIGHHGAPVSSETLSSGKEVFGEGGLAAAADFARAAAALLFPHEPLRIIQAKEAQRHEASWLVAGVAVLADWIGSNQNWFPYRAPDMALGTYWDEVAIPGAERALDEAGVLPTAPALPAASFRDLFDFESGSVQTWASTVRLPDGPLLIVIEDVTGSGKTEAALMLAHRLIAVGRASGLYIGLPTMATANAMYARLGETYRRLFSDSSTPSLVLSHSARSLHAGFRASVLDAGRHEALYAPGHTMPAEEPASRACAAWIADDRRRAFLADVGVGTIDQALLAVLPSRHQSLRLLGLSSKVLIVDEVHAYDAYMSQELATLIEFQAALGGSTILLSATLSQTERRGLLKRFARTVACANGDVQNLGTAYPLVTLASSARAEESPQTVRPELERSVPVKLTDSEDEVRERIKAAVGAGAAACWIRNTVDEALASYESLVAEGLSAELFHARFALSDRLRIEDAVLRRFGKSSTAAERQGHVLVATQVVEQSLDIDFDFMVTDLAPIDLVIQRAGRLARHLREGRPVEPQLLVLSPVPSDDAGARWARDTLRGTIAVYRDPSLLWRSARVLGEAGAIVTPDNVKALIEAVYGEDARDRVPPQLLREVDKSEGRAGADRGIAVQNLLKRSAGYVREAGLWDLDIRTPTRLGEPQTTLRLARWEGGKLVPWAVDAPRRLAWRLSEVSVRAVRINDEAPYAPTLANQIAQLKGNWSRWEAECVVVPLASGEDSHWRGRACLRTDRRAAREIPLSYSGRTGLRYRI